MMDDITPRFLCVGTHHKTGTIWLRRVFRTIAAELGLAYQFVHRATPLSKLPESGRAILFNWSSRFSNELLNNSATRILHMIRDPRDVLISGMKYHQIAPVAGEEFLHEPRRDLGGKTYQQHLNSLPDTVEKLRFEMKNKHRETLSDMLDWDYQNPNSAELRYENLMVDENCQQFEDILYRFGFRPHEITKGKQIFWNNSLFGGMAKPDQRDKRIKLHVQSGAVAQWQTALPREVAEEYLHLHGDDLIELGYEKDKNWLDRLAA